MKNIIKNIYLRSEYKIILLTISSIYDIILLENILVGDFYSKTKTTNSLKSSSTTN